MIIYSIIIPHKNIPELLERCLCSIPQRDDMEVIVVDYNSDATKVDFSSFPGLNRRDVKVIFSKEGKGAGYCRNIGMDKACGKWLIFADADDLFTVDAFDTFSKFKDSLNDIVFFGFNTLDCITLKPRESRIPEQVEFIRTNNINAMLFQTQVPWAKMISSKLIKKYKIRFSETIAANDVMFSIRSSYHADRVEICNKPVYSVTFREGSLINTFSSQVLLARLRITGLRNRYVRKNHIKVEQYALFSFYCKCKVRGKASMLYFRALLLYLYYQPLKLIIDDYRKLKGVR